MSTCHLIIYIDAEFLRQHYGLINLETSLLYVLKYKVYTVYCIIYLAKPCTELKSLHLCLQYQELKNDVNAAVISIGCIASISMSMSMRCLKILYEECACR